MPSQPPPEDQVGTRDRPIGAMVESLGTRGFHGVGISELLSRARAPEGVLYHHRFPGGKAGLAVAAADTVVGHVTTSLEALFEPQGDPVQALTRRMKDAQATLLGSRCDRGCPLATIAQESTAEDRAIRGAVGRGFSTLRDGSKRAWVAGSGRPLQDTTTLLLDTLEGLLLPQRRS